jgi:glycosyltransferase involved in cell wall biosynthesis
MSPSSPDTRASRSTLWITWEHHRRTIELCRALSIDLCELISHRSRALRYVALIVRTVRCLARRRPSLVVVQCPSVVLGLVVAMLKPFLRFTLVADLHNEAVKPYSISSRLYQLVLAFIHRTADLCIVSNAHLAPIVEAAGGRTFVLPDKLPDLQPRPTVTPNSTRTVVFVCTYARDEPFREVIEAARLLDPSVTVMVTGDHRRVDALRPPDNVYLTGFVSERDYVALLRIADAIVDLTSIEDCLVCGAYEAVALGKPLVTSDTAALREYFHRGTVYTKHDRRSLAAAMTDALANSDRLTVEMRGLRAELSRNWTRQRDALRRLLPLDGRTHTGNDLLPLAMGH